MLAAIEHITQKLGNTKPGFFLVS